MSDWTGSDILYNLTYFTGPLVCDNKTITQAMSGVDSSMEWKEKKKHLEAAGITPRNIPPVCIYG
jgi:hypothetical protein